MEVGLLEHSAPDLQQTKLLSAEMNRLQVFAGFWKAAGVAKLQIKLKKR